MFAQSFGCIDTAVHTCTVLHCRQHLSVAQHHAISILSSDLHGVTNMSQTHAQYNNAKHYNDGNTTNIPIYQPYNLSKRNGERFYFYWSFVWISIMAYIVYTRIFEEFTAQSYMSVGLIIGVPPIVIPILLPQYCDNAKLPLFRRYTTKANLFIVILSFIGNYLWTHYFYTVLGCSYTFPADRLNDVPIALYLITISYFHLYHLLSNVCIRVLYRINSTQHYYIQQLIVLLFILSLSYFLAFAETFTIQHFQYYVIPNQYNMYVIGSAFYAIYFIYSFPYFYIIDEQLNECHSMKHVFLLSMTACMCVTMTCDFWRLIGPNLANIDNKSTSKTLPWLSHTHIS